MPTRGTFLKAVFAVITVCLGLPPLRAEVRLPAVLGDHMVIQRGLPAHVWGTAAPAEPVTVSFRGATVSTAADELGRWNAYLPAGDAGGPFDLAVSAANTIRLTDVLVGDVWVASGQSNMEFMLKGVDNADAEVAEANYAKLRLFEVKHRVADHPREDVESKGWAACTPASARDFSAVAYFFGRNLHRQLSVPVGLINASWGGTPADSWTSLRALSSDAALMPVFVEWNRMTENLPVTRQRREKQLAAWREAAARARAEGTEPPGWPWAPNDEGEWAPAGLYNGMIAPLTRLPIRGVIWYQGESNAMKERVALYSRLFAAMIQDWRRAWGQGDFPFLFVQLANFKTGPESRWPELREAQTNTLALASTGMAVTIDIGNPADIHPRNKQDVGGRLALAARAIAYGETIEYSGPLFRLATPEGSAMRVWFDHASGMRAKGDALRGFEIAGRDGEFVAAEARVDGHTVVVSSPAVAAPTQVRYAWSDNPECNLYNGDGLPASPFRSPQ